MSLLSRLSSILFGNSKPSEPPAPPTLRNRAGGMAWIRGIEELNGRVVTTVRAYGENFWVIEPPQEYVARQIHHSLNGYVVYPGEGVRTIGLSDRCLEPIPDTGITQEEVDQLYAPGPVLIPLQVKGEVH